MRIALITREYPPETSWGGIGTFYSLFAQSLVKAGCDVEVFTQGLYRPSTEKINRVLVHKVLPRKWLVGSRCGGNLGGNSRLGVFALSLALEMLSAFSRRHRRRRFDIVEGHEHLGINSLINVVFSKSALTVTRYHTAYYTLVKRNLVNWPDSPIINKLEWLSLRSARYRISPSHFIDQVTQRDFPGIYSADAMIPLTVNGIESRMPVGRERLIVFVGRMMPGHKNPDMAARAFAAVAEQFPEWRIEFAGLDIAVNPHETMWQRCEKMLAPFQGRYKYHGVLSREAVNVLYKRASISLIPSRFESFGLVALEAITAGCVPVVADDTALCEVIGDCGIVFKNGSIEDLIDKLRYLMSNDPVLQAKSSQALMRTDAFSQSAIMRMNLDFLEKALINQQGR